VKVPDQDDPKPRSRARGSRKKSHPADIAAEAEAEAAAAAKPRRKGKVSNPPEISVADVSSDEPTSETTGETAETTPGPSSPPISALSSPGPASPSPPKRREVENWLAQRLAALDPGEEEDVGDPATHIAHGSRSDSNRSRASQPPLRSPTSSRAPVSMPPRRGAPRPTPTVPTPAPASVVVQRRTQRESSTPPQAPSQALTGPGPARVQIPGHPQHGGSAQPTPAGGQEMQVMVVAPSVPTPPLPPRASADFVPADSEPADEKTPIPQEPWPDFEPLSLPSEEVEPLDDAATPLHASPAQAQAAHAQVAPQQVAPDAQRTLPAGRMDEDAWDLLGESDGRGRPAVDDDRTGPGGWATPLPSERHHQPIAQVQVATPASQEATILNTGVNIGAGIGHMPKRSSLPSGPPVVTSAPAPVRPRPANEEAQVDALIAEVERDPRSPRRKPGPFSRWNEDADISDPGDKRRTSVTPSMMPTLTALESETQTREADGLGSYDEVFPQAGGVARVLPGRSPARDEETAALLMDGSDPAAHPAAKLAAHVAAQVDPQATPLAAPQVPGLPPLRPSSGVTGTTPPPAPVSAAPPAELPRAGEETTNDPGTKTEWRPRAKGRDLDEKPLADEKTEIRSFTPKIDTVGDEDAPTAQTLRVEAVTAADLPTAPELDAPRERGGINLWPWMSVGAGMLAFLVPLGIFAAILMVVKWFM
jgi:hypothetical protein